MTVLIIGTDLAEQSFHFYDSGTLVVRLEDAADFGEGCVKHVLTAGGAEYHSVDVGQERRIPIRFVVE